MGRLVWNRSQKVRDPDTGRRITRRRPESEWVWTDAPDLRIIPDDLWNKIQARVQARYQEQRWAGCGRTRDPRGGQRRHLFSGLLVCGVCGSAYTIYRANYYGCASATHRGSAICANGRLARKDVLEERLLRAIEERVFSPEAVAYLTRQVNAALEQQARRHPASDARQQRLEADLAKARAELGNITGAIRQGIITPITKAMLEDAEANVAHLEASLADPPDVPAKAVAVIPSVVAGYLKDLRRVLGRDTEQARAILRDLLDEITLQPDDKGLVAVLRGNVPGIVGLPLRSKWCRGRESNPHGVAPNGF